MALKEFSAKSEVGASRVNADRLITSALIRYLTESGALKFEEYTAPNLEGESVAWVRATLRAEVPPTVLEERKHDNGLCYWCGHTVGTKPRNRGINGNSKVAHDDEHGRSAMFCDSECLHLWQSEQRDLSPDYPPPPPDKLFMKPDLWTGHVCDWCWGRAEGAGLLGFSSKPLTIDRPAQDLYFCDQECCQRWRVWEKSRAEAGTW